MIQTIDGKPYVHHVQIPVRFSETDANGHVSHHSYVIYCEQARTQFIDELLGPEYDWGQNMLVLAHQSITYHKPAFFRQTLNVYSGIERLGRSSMDFYYRIDIQGAPGMITSGYATVVLVDHDTGKGTPWPSSLRSKVEQLMIPVD